MLTIQQCVDFDAVVVLVCSSFVLYVICTVTSSVCISSCISRSCTGNSDVVMNEGAEVQ